MYQISVNFMMTKQPNPLYTEPFGSPHLYVTMSGEFVSSLYSECLVFMTNHCKLNLAVMLPGKDADTDPRGQSKSLYIWISIHYSDTLFYSYIIGHEIW